jgi:hypothetical protein
MSFMKLCSGKKSSLKFKRRKGGKKNTSREMCMRVVLHLIMSIRKIHISLSRLSSIHPFKMIFIHKKHFESFG